MSIYEVSNNLKLFIPLLLSDPNTSNVKYVGIYFRSKDSYTIVEYLPSPQVALHQVGFHHSKFGSQRTTAKNTNDTLVIWAPVSTLPQYTFILHFGVIIINLIHEYSSIKRPLVYGPINIISVPAILNGYEIGSWNLLTNG